MEINLFVYLRLFNDLCCVCCVVPDLTRVPNWRITSINFIFRSLNFLAFKAMYTA